MAIEEPERKTLPPPSSDAWSRREALSIAVLRDAVILCAVRSVDVAREVSSGGKNLDALISAEEDLVASVEHLKEAGWTP